jgi:DNA-binding transcriptional MerR regulator
MVTAQSLTTGEMARQIGVAVHRVEYVIKSRSIQPVERAGTLRIFSEADRDFIAAELRRIDEER